MASSNIEDSLSCGVCFEKYNNSNHLPKILPCHHTFCSSCIQRLATKGSEAFQCPVCCCTVQASADIRTNLAVRDVAEAVFDRKVTISCPDHPGKECHFICMDCNQPICSLCIKGLVKGKHKKHTIEDVEEAKAITKKRLVVALEEKLSNLDVGATEDMNKLKQEQERHSAEVNAVIVRIHEELGFWKEGHLQDWEIRTKTALSQQQEVHESQKTYWQRKRQVSDFLEMLEVLKELANETTSTKKSGKENTCLQKENIDHLQDQLNSVFESLRKLLKDGKLSSSVPPLGASKQNSKETQRSTDPIASPTSTQTGMKISSSTGHLPLSRSISHQGGPDAQTPESSLDRPMSLQDDLAFLSDDFLSDSQAVHRADGTVILQEVECDLFSLPEFYSLAHCVSADFHMGKGIAVQFKKRFGRVAELLSSNAHTGQIACLKQNQRFIYYLVTKERFNRKPTMWTLESSLRCLRDHCVQNQVQYLAMPTIGCGWDKLDWCNVRQLLVDIFRDTQVEIMVCVM